jgi:hypothetical protein
VTLVSGDILVYDGNNWVNSSYAGCPKAALRRPGRPYGQYGSHSLADGGRIGARGGSQ